MMVALTIVVGIVFIFLQYLIWSKTRSNLHQEKSRLTKELNLINAKLAILEDLSQKVDYQRSQLEKMLELKTSQLDELIKTAQETIKELQKQLEQVELDPQELLERQNAIKLVQAALLANKGYPPEKIREITQLGLQECELIYALNKDQLQFDLNTLPSWIKKQIHNDHILV